jgi:hypothetical protein
MAKTKYVKVEMTLVIVDDSEICKPVNQWLPNTVLLSLGDGEYILDYHDNEAEVDAKWGTEPAQEN